MADKKTSTTSTKKQKRRSVPNGQLHIQATFNNTIITFSDKKGNVISTASSGGCGFRGSKKGTAYAAQVAGEKAADKAKNQYGMSTVDVFIKGVGMGRDAAVRNLGQYGMTVESIKDVTPIPHGGARPRKQRRA